VWSGDLAELTDRVGARDRTSLISGSSSSSIGDCSPPGPPIAAWHAAAIAEATLRLDRAKSLAKQVCALAVAQSRCSCRRVQAAILGR